MASERGATAGGSGPYVPALAYRWLTPLYDPVVRFTTRERAFKDRLLRQASIAAGMDVLDLACGTGTLAVWIKQREPGARVTGIDGDPEVLRRAGKKAAEGNVAIAFDAGLSYELPYPDQSFDRVLSSLFFHHLTPEAKRRTLAEVRRVLRPGGQIHIADWGEPTGPLMRVLARSIVLLDGREQTADNLAGRLPAFLAGAGFNEVQSQGWLRTPFGSLHLLAGTAPAV